MLTLFGLLSSQVTERGKETNSGTKTLTSASFTSEKPGTLNPHYEQQSIDQLLFNFVGIL